MTNKTLYYFDSGVVDENNTAYFNTTIQLVRNFPDTMDLLLGESYIAREEIIDTDDAAATGTIRIFSQNDSLPFQNYGTIIDGYGGLDMYFSGVQAAFNYGSIVVSAIGHEVLNISVASDALNVNQHKPAEFINYGHITVQDAATSSTHGVGSATLDIQSLGGAPHAPVVNYGTLQASGATSRINVLVGNGNILDDSGVIDIENRASLYLGAPVIGIGYIYDKGNSHMLIDSSIGSGQIFEISNSTVEFGTAATLASFAGLIDTIVGPSWFFLDSVHATSMVFATNTLSEHWGPNAHDLELFDQSHHLIGNIVLGSSVKPSGFSLAPMPTLNYSVLTYHG